MDRICSVCGQTKQWAGRGLKCPACVKAQTRSKANLAWRSISGHPAGGYFVAPGQCRVLGTAAQYQACLNPACPHRLPA